MSELPYVGSIFPDLAEPRALGRADRAQCAPGTARTVWGPCRRQHVQPFPWKGLNDAHRVVRWVISGGRGGRNLHRRVADPFEKPVHRGDDVGSGPEEDMVNHRTFQPAAPQASDEVQLGAVRRKEHQGQPFRVHV